MRTLDEVYHLAADMGGMGFISVAECEVLHDNALINIQMTHTAAQMSVPRYFLSSSVCVYRNMQPGEPELTEDDAIPAQPDNEYGWEKLYAERVAMAYGRHSDMNVRIAPLPELLRPGGDTFASLSAGLARRTGEGAGGDLHLVLGLSTGPQSCGSGRWWYN